MKWSVENKVLAGFVVALAVIAMVGGLAYQASYHYIEMSKDMVQNHQDALVSLEEIYSLVSQAESSQRAYLITSDESYYLQQRQAVVSRIWERLAWLKQISPGEPGRQQRLQQIEQRLAARLDILDRVFALRQTRGLDAAREQLLSGAGRAAMEQLHDSVDFAKNEEKNRLKEHTEEAQGYAERILSTLSATLLFVVVFMALLFLRIRREMGERRRAVEALQQSSARIDMLLNSVAEGIYGVDMQGNCTFINPAGLHLLGYQEETELLGKHMHDLIHHTRANGSHYPATECRLYCCLQSHENIHVDDELFWRKDGSSFLVDYWSRPIESNGEVNGAVVTFFDITERKQAEEQRVLLVHELESANEELRNFGYVVSHDLKAPLRAIGSLADWISTDYADKFDDEGKEHMRLLISRVRRMDSLIDGILQYSRVGRVKEVAVAVDINGLVREVIDLLAPPENITISIVNSLPTITAEPTRIQQVFQNLLSNAIKYMDKPKGEIRIACGAENGQWKFTITDNGPGIDQQHFEKIFQLFQTLAPRDRVESTGVGLALVKKIVEMYGGHIWLESTVGRGSTFFFTLPRTTATSS
ncbi:MAG: CHASE3 domain-containing protein [Betaproteobacteria bacterium]|nr:CHASE3 domain-containing protein [Betaproteobacteria bacterium]MDE2309438.1 CHASE3 domain-containing protein [Betaproteobacteria bacterium]